MKRARVLGAALLALAVFGLVFIATQGVERLGGGFAFLLFGAWSVFRGRTTRRGRLGPPALLFLAGLGVSPASAHGVGEVGRALGSLFGAVVLAALFAAFSLWVERGIARRG